MKKVLLFLTICILAACSSSRTPEHPSGLEIIEVKPNKWTSIMKQNMLQLAQVYDLTPFLFTKKIQVESFVIPHSHPVLTLNTKNAQEPKKILSVWLHEELHWWLEKNPKAANLAIGELKKIYPKAPVDPKKPISTYVHLIICYLELKSLGHYIGEREARGIVSEIMKKDKIYPWVYFQVLNRDFAIKKVVEKHKLVPKPL
jgi:hypothetical protein